MEIGVDYGKGDNCGTRNQSCNRTLTKSKAILKQEVNYNKEIIMRTKIKTTRNSDKFTQNVVLEWLNDQN